MSTPVPAAALTAYPGRPRRVLFLARENRFLVRVRDPELGEVEAHLRNPGRMRELLRPGEVEGHIVPSPPGAGRKTQWTLVNIASPEGDGRWVSVDAQIASRVVAQALEAGACFPLQRWGRWRSEVVWGDCRFDHAVPASEPRRPPRALLEVKSSNLREGSSALFPDAPTSRGEHHAETLARFMGKEGRRAALLFLVQRDDVQEVRPYGAMDPKFAHAVIEASRRGVLLLGRTLRVEPNGVRWGRDIPVRSPRWEPASDLGGSHAAAGASHPGPAE